MIRTLPTRPRLVFASTQAKSGSGAARNALTLARAGRLQIAVALLEELPELIAAEVDAADRCSYARGHQRGLRDVFATFPARSCGGSVRQPGWLLEGMTDPARFEAIREATELRPGQLRAVAEGRASLGPGMLARARAALRLT